MMNARIQRSQHTGHDSDQHEQNRAPAAERHACLLLKWNFSLGLVSERLIPPFAAAKRLPKYPMQDGAVSSGVVRGYGRIRPAMPNRVQDQTERPTHDQV